jgi:hypothetical protein
MRDRDGERRAALALCQERLAASEQAQAAMRAEFDDVAKERDALYEWKIEAQGTLMSAGALTAEMHGREARAIEARDKALEELTQAANDRDDAREAANIAITIVENLSRVVINGKRALDEALVVEDEQDAEPAEPVSEPSA